jgi:hypothetical protein
MVRPPAEGRLVPMTVKIDPELKALVGRLSEHERRTASMSSGVLIQFGLLKWLELGSLQRMIDEVDKAWEKTLPMRRELARAR